MTKTEFVKIYKDQYKIWSDCTPGEQGCRCDDHRQVKIGERTVENKYDSNPYTVDILKWQGLTYKKQPTEVTKMVTSKILSPAQQKEVEKLTSEVTKMEQEVAEIETTLSKSFLENLIGKLKINQNVLDPNSKIESNFQKIKEILSNPSTSPEENIKNLNILFETCSSFDESYYKAMSKKGECCFMHSRSLVLYHIRNRGMEQLQQIIKSNNSLNKDERRKLMASYRNMPLFKEHRRTGFFQTIGRTDAVILIDNFIDKSTHKINNYIQRAINI